MYCPRQNQILLLRQPQAQRGVLGVQSRGKLTSPLFRAIYSLVSNFHPRHYDGLFHHANCLVHHSHDCARTVHVDLEAANGLLRLIRWFEILK